MRRSYLQRDEAVESADERKGILDKYFMYKLRGGGWSIGLGCVPKRRRFRNKHRVLVGVYPG
jgi:hypothetical protein